MALHKNLTQFLVPADFSCNFSCNFRPIPPSFLKASILSRVLLFSSSLFKNWVEVLTNVESVLSRSGTGYGRRSSCLDRVVFSEIPEAM